MLVLLGYRNVSVNVFSKDNKGFWRHFETTAPWLGEMFSANKRNSVRGVGSGGWIVRGGIVWELLTGEQLSIGETTTRGDIYIYKAKVKWSRYRAGVIRGIVLLFHDRGTRRCEWTEGWPDRYLTHWKFGYTFYRRHGGRMGVTDGRKISYPPGFDPRPLSP